MTDQPHALPPRQEDERRDPSPAPQPTGDAVAETPRHLFTLRVEDVAQMLADQNVPRDVRTIQRWCKAQKIKAIIDDHDIERYLIEPGSVRDMIATLQAERSRHVAPNLHPSRRVFSDAAASPEPAAASVRDAVTGHADGRHADAATSEPAATTADARRDDVASLRRRVEELEEKNRSLEVDKRVRDQLLERQERHYQQMIGEAFARSERVGELEAENRQLRQLLPPGAGEQQPKAHPPFSFTPRSVVEQGDNPEESPAAERYNHGYGRQWPEASA